MLEGVLKERRYGAYEYLQCKVSILGMLEGVLKENESQQVSVNVHVSILGMLEGVLKE